MITVTALKCPKCEDVIYSRAHHDFHHCSCGSCAIDGGFDYCRLLYPPKMGKPETFQIEIEATKKDLYDDWNHNKNKYGLIKSTNKNYKQ
jgi:hypothetical protein